MAGELLELKEFQRKKAVMPVEMQRLKRDLERDYNAAVLWLRTCQAKKDIHRLDCYLVHSKPSKNGVI